MAHRQHANTTAVRDEGLLPPKKALIISDAPSPIDCILDQAKLYQLAEASGALLGLLSPRVFRPSISTQ